MCEKRDGWDKGLDMGWDRDRQGGIGDRLRRDRGLDIGWDNPANFAVSDR